MDIQRLRNLTTLRLHTKMDHIYQDVDYLTGTPGVMTHQLSRAARALLPYLQRQLQDRRFFEDTYDVTHVGEVEISPMGPEDLVEFWRLYSEQPDPLVGKDVVTVLVD